MARVQGHDPTPGLAAEFTTHPLVARTFDTRTASLASEHLDASTTPEPASSETSGQAERFPSPRNGRSQSVAHHPPATRQLIRRKPLSSTASPIAAAFAPLGILGLAAPSMPQEERFSRAFSLDSPTVPGFYHHTPGVAADQVAESRPGHGTGAAEARNIQRARPVVAEEAVKAAVNSDATVAHELKEPSMSLVARRAPPPHLTLAPAHTATRAKPLAVDTTTTIAEDSCNKPLPQTPSDLDIFFGWGYSPPVSSTEFSDDQEHKLSPLLSPTSTKPTTLATHDYSTIVKTPKSTNAIDYFQSYLRTPSSTSTTTAQSQIEEMEDELRAISAELASSIRREMDLEDIVDRLHDQVHSTPVPGKRSSDYYSDSGYSSARFSDFDQAKEEILQVRRRSEQEQARIRLELGQKLQQERDKRRELDQKIQELSQRVAQLDAAPTANKDVTVRVKELESQCGDLRRKVAEERQFKENYEDLLNALKDEFQDAANERDNLRDEVLPSLRSRVEGLEAEAADITKSAYDATKLQQELRNLRQENTELKQTGSRVSIGRSASIAGGSLHRKTRPPSLARSSTVKVAESREVLAERLEDVEAQRDALHNALKSLLERQELQNRDNEKKIGVLEQECERLMGASPRKFGYEKEVGHLREEINALRRRAEDALEQKWRVEKGLAGLRIDLDRAEQEVAALRGLLKEHDISIPDGIGRYSTSHRLSMAAASESLELAYRDLKDSYREALDRIKALESQPGNDEKTRLAMERLEQSLSNSNTERDLARSEIQGLHSQVELMQTSERNQLEAEGHLASQLSDSARRVEELSQQLHSQLATNASLRTRLTDMVNRGEVEQRTSKERITALQSRLQTLETQLLTTQTAAEERVARHEADIVALKETHNTQLQRLRSPGLLSPRFQHKSPLSPLLPVVAGRRPSSSRSSARLSPRLGDGRRSYSQPPKSPAADAIDVTEQVSTLRRRVVELEAAVDRADVEMQQVVGLMSKAQIEVLTLQEEREAAARETRQLRRALEEEKARTFTDRFMTISTEVK